MKTLDLCGSWQVRKSGEQETVPATVPGCIHTDLLAAGQIEDPFFRDNEHRYLWIGETDWSYSRTFEVEQDFLAHERILLRCEGLDTLGTITLNGVEIGTTNNQFRSWEFDVKSYLLAGENSIEVFFASTIPFITAEQQKRYLNLSGVGHHRIDGSNRVRKSQCNYGWDWGPMCVTAGIWQPIGLIAYNTARITDVHITQDHSQKRQVELQAAVSVEGTAITNPLIAKISVFYEDNCIGQTEVDIQNATVQADLMIKDPHLWWPNGMGEQPLYDVTIDVLENQSVLDTVTKRIGLRTLTLDRHQDDWGQSFQFAVNGVPFFAKGANWIPADTFVTRLTKGRYEHLIKSAADAHINMLRVWGGGIYEADIFYDLCDRYGICVWQDFMFACSAYPAFDDVYMENVKQEAEDQVKRLRHHPSLALWCGNNELEQIFLLFIGDPEEDKTMLEKSRELIEESPAFMRDHLRSMLQRFVLDGKMSWQEYKLLFDELLLTVVREHDPERSYWPSSPHSPVGDRRDHFNPTCGDAHLWNVWHEREPFEWYRSSTHRFVSEFGFQSFPEPAVVESYTCEEDRNVTSYVMEHHQRSWIGNTAIMQYMLDWFKLPARFDMILWLSQILQGLGIKYGVEHWRRSRPRGMGTLYWQLNDCWPGASWSSIDYVGNWKALHYMACDFYAPLLISAIEHGERGEVEVHITSDLLEPACGVLEWTLTDTLGTVLVSNRLDCQIAPAADTKVMGLQLADHLAEYGAGRLLLWLELYVEDAVVSHNLVWFARPKHLKLQEPHLTPSIHDMGHGTFEVRVDARYPALWVWCEVSGVHCTYSKQFFHLLPGKPVSMTIRPAADLSLSELETRLRVRSLVDTWR